MKVRLIFLLSSLAVALVLLLPTSAFADNGPVIHQVQRGETLMAIAQQYGVTVEDLMRLNNLRNANRLYAGQRLVVRPGQSSENSGVHVVRKGDTLSKIAEQYGTSVADILRANGLRSSIIYVGQRLKIPGQETGSDKAGDKKANTKKTVVHEVRRGETLAQIAQFYGVPVSQIAKLNGIKDKSLIRVGDKLVISGNPKKVIKKKRRVKKKFVVDISEQRCWRYEGDKLLNTWKCSTGRNNSTKAGKFRVQSKLRKAYGSTWNIWMPWWLGIYWSGPIENGIHGLPWDAKTGGRTWAGLVGRPITYGCVMLNDKNAETLWKWADIGTQVIIKR
jgi:LysM repeat protein